DLIHEAGISGMRKLISDTAKWGELTVGPKIIDRTVQKRMKSALQKIRSGQFAREFIREMKPPRTRYAQLLLDAEKHPIEKVGACGHSVAHLLRGLGDLLWLWPEHDVLARISSSRCAKRERKHDARASDRPAAQATWSVYCFHGLIVMRLRISRKFISPSI